MKGTQVGMHKEVEKRITREASTVMMAQKQASLQEKREIFPSTNDNMAIINKKLIKFENMLSPLHPPPSMDTF